MMDMMEEVEYYIEKDAKEAYCDECEEWVPRARWFYFDAYCETCGDHPGMAHYDNDDQEGFTCRGMDMVYTDGIETR